MHLTAQMTPSSPENAPLRRTACLGGSFDPVHVGHAAIAASLAATGFARVLLVPAARNPHKATPPLIPDQFRLEALRAVAVTMPGVTVWEGELRRPPPSFTIDTVRQLIAEGLGPVTWVVGADSLAGLPRWKEAPALATLASFLAVARPGFDRAAATTRARSAFPGLRLDWLDLPERDVSSTEVRRRLATGSDWRALVPTAAHASVERALRGLKP